MSIYGKNATIHADSAAFDTSTTEVHARSIGILSGSFFSDAGSTASGIVSLWPGWLDELAMSMPKPGPVPHAVNCEEL